MEQEKFMPIEKIGFFLIGLILFVLVPLLTYSNSQYRDKCEAKGGYVLSGKGILQCIKKEDVIEIK